jgi:hypothetical protein
MTATQLRYRRCLKQARATLAMAEFCREYRRFTDCEFTFTGRSVTTFAKEPNADLADICETAILSSMGPIPRRATSNCIECASSSIALTQAQ